MVGWMSLSMTDLPRCCFQIVAWYPQFILIVQTGPWATSVVMVASGCCSCSLVLVHGSKSTVHPVYRLAGLDDFRKGYFLPLQFWDWSNPSLQTTPRVLTTNFRKNLKEVFTWIEGKYNTTHTPHTHPGCTHLSGCALSLALRGLLARSLPVKGCMQHTFLSWVLNPTMKPLRMEEISVCLPSIDVRPPLLSVVKGAAGQPAFRSTRLPHG